MFNIFKKNKQKEEDKPKYKFGSKEWLYDFFIPRNIIDVVFIVVCFILMWYALTYDIPNAKVPVICATYWNKWAAEKAALLGGFNITPMSNATPVLNCYTNISLGNLTVP